MAAGGVIHAAACSLRLPERPGLRRTGRRGAGHPGRLAAPAPRRSSLACPSFATYSTRPYTVVAVLILVSLLAVGAALRMPVDIFPEIDIPVVSVVWTYDGMSAPDIQNRILTLHERQLASLVDDISRIEATSYQGVGVEKIYLHEGADVTRAISQLASSALVVLKYMPPNITPPLVIRYGATDVPIIQLSLSSHSLPDTKLNDLGQNIIRPALAVVHGAEVPYPYGGKPRVIMADLDPKAMQARGLSPADVSSALLSQNVILPAGDVKIGSRDYTLTMNNSPDLIEAINNFPVKRVDGRTVFMHDVAHVHDGFQVQTNSVSVDGVPGALMSIRKTGGVSTLAVINGIRDALPEIRKMLPADVSIKPIFDQSVFVKAALNSVVMGGCMAAGLTALMILLFLGNWRLTLIILASIPLSILTAVLIMGASGETLNTMTLGGFALAVGILVDNGTVVIENIERHAGSSRAHRCDHLWRRRSWHANGALDPVHLYCLRPGFPSAGHCQVPVLATVCIGDHLAAGEPGAVLHPGAHALQLSHARAHAPGAAGRTAAAACRRPAVGCLSGPPRGAPAVWHHLRFERGFNALRERYRNTLVMGIVSAAGRRCISRTDGGLAAALPAFGQGFLSPGGCRPDAAARPRTAGHTHRDHSTGLRGGRIGDQEARRQLQISVILDNIGLPYSGINVALSDSATVGPMDGEILISLKKSIPPRRHLWRCCAGSCRGASRDSCSSFNRRTSLTRC